MDNLTNVLAEAGLVIGAGFGATILIRRATDAWLERGNADARARRRARAADAWHEAQLANCTSRCTSRERRRVTTAQRRSVARQGRADAQSMQMHQPRGDA